MIGKKRKTTSTRLAGVLVALFSDEAGAFAKEWQEVLVSSA